MTLNFHDFDALLEKGREIALQLTTPPPPSGEADLKPIEDEELGTAARDPEAEQQAVNQQCKIQSFETWLGKQSNLQTVADSGGLEPIKDLKVGVRPS